MPYLYILKGPAQGSRLPLERDSTVLGRDPNCHVVLKSTGRTSKAAAVSRKHAVISHFEGKYYLEDGDGHGKKSHNNTFLNGAPVAFPGRVQLHHKDIIRLCDFTFVFRDRGINDADSSLVEVSVKRDSDSVFSQTADKLKLLLEISNRLSNSLDLDTLLPQVVDSLLQHFKQAARGFLIEADEKTGAHVARIFKCQTPEDQSANDFSDSIVAHCLATVQGKLSNDPGQDFPDSESVAELSLRSVMCAPLWTQDGKAFGVILLDSRDGRKQFTQGDLNFLMGVANQASICLANARYHQEALARERRDRDLAVAREKVRGIRERRDQDLALAREVARSFLPLTVPTVPGYEFFASNESALDVGGDYYDFLPLKDGCIAVLVGDVAGKGVAAALVMARFSAEARACLRTGSDLAAAIRELNDLMQPLNLTDRFVTLAVLLLDPRTHTVTMVYAGHPPPLLLGHASGAIEEASPRAAVGPPLGVWDGYPFEAHQIVLQPGDSLVIFSDGVTEAMDAQENQLGEKGLLAVLAQPNVPPRQLGERILQTVKEHAAGCSQHDDITLVCLGRLAST